MGKLTSFGVDMFFLNLLESKKMGKLTSFGVDMFLLNLLESKKWTNYILVLVVTCYSQIPGVQKMGKID